MKEKLDRESLELWRKITDQGQGIEWDAIWQPRHPKMQTILCSVQSSSRHGTYIQIATNKKYCKFLFIPKTKTLIEWNLLPP